MGDDEGVDSIVQEGGSDIIYTAHTAKQASVKVREGRVS
jgi:hypothetical protein